MQKFFSGAIILSFVFLGLVSAPVFSAQAASASQIEKAERDLEMEEALRKRLAEEEKILIKKIIVKDAKAVNKKEINTLIQPYQKQWLTKNDIEQVLYLIKNLYAQKKKPIPIISYQIKKQVLEIRVNEVKS